MSTRSALKTELAPLLKKNLRSHITNFNMLLKDDSAVIVNFYIEIDRQLTEFFDRHPELDAEIDVGKALTTSLNPITDALTASLKTLQNMISSYGEVQRGKMLSRNVVVRSKGRATLSMFPPGTRLRVTELRRGDGSLGGVQLIVKE